MSNNFTAEYLNFDESDFLTYDDLNKFIESSNPLEQSEIISTKLMQKVLINHGTLYLYKEENVTYQKMEYKNDKCMIDYLLIIVRKLITLSYQNLTSDHKDVIVAKHFKTVGNKCSKLCMVTFCKDIIGDIQFMLINNTFDFHDANKNEIHFRNGYYDLLEDEFKDRDPDTHFVSIYINRDYKEPSKKIIHEIESSINKILPHKCERDYILSTLGKSLTGDVIDDQKNLFLLGAGSNGKSVLMKMVKFAVNVYFLELQSDTFSKGNNKVDKILNEFQSNTFLRYAWINEMQDKKINDTLFKSFCEGLLQTTSLYKDGLNNFKHYCKLIFTSNSFPNINIDSGISRRIEACELGSLFVDNENDVDEDNHIYLKNIKLLDKFENNVMYQNGFFKILTRYCKDWIDDKTLYKLPKSFKDSKDLIVDINDIIGNFLSNNTVKTSDEKDKIDRNDLYDRFMLENSKSIITQQQFFNSARQRGLKYNQNARDSKGDKGCYTNVKFLRYNPEVEFQCAVDSSNENPTLKSSHEAEINELKKQIAELQEQLAKKPTKTATRTVTKKVKVKKIEIPEDSDEDENEDEIKRIADLI